MFRPGEYPHRVTLQALDAETSDGHDGYAAPTYTSVQLRVPARVKPLLGRDLERARQIDPRTSHEVRLRYWRAYRDDLQGGRGQVLYHDQATDRALEIVAPPMDVDEQHVELLLLCREAA